VSTPLLFRIFFERARSNVVTVVLLFLLLKAVEKTTTLDERRRGKAILVLLAREKEHDANREDVWRRRASSTLSDFVGPIALILVNFLWGKHDKNTRFESEEYSTFDHS